MSNACAFIIFNISIVDLWSWRRGEWAGIKDHRERDIGTVVPPSPFALPWHLRVRNSCSGEQTLLFRENQDNYFVILHPQGSRTFFLFYEFDDLLSFFSLFYIMWLKIKFSYPQEENRYSMTNAGEQTLLFRENQDNFVILNPQGIHFSFFASSLKTNTTRIWWISIFAFYIMWLKIKLFYPQENCYPMTNARNGKKRYFSRKEEIRRTKS